MGFTGTFVVCRTPKSPVDILAELDESDVEPAGTWPAPWRVWRVWATTRYDLPEDAWDTLAEAAHPILACEVIDSDGSHITAVSEPAGRWETYLQLDRLLAHTVPSYSPFDDDGNFMDDEALADLQAVYERKLAEVRARLIDTVPMGITAAERAAMWARDAGLSPAPAADLVRVLEAETVFVEEQIFELLGSLGLAELLD